MTKRFAVLRDCCTIGNCDKCNGVTPFGVKLRVCQTSLHGGVTKKYAAEVAHNWRAYNAEVVPLDVAKQTDDDTQARIEEKHKRNEPINRRWEEMKAAERREPETMTGISDLLKF